MTPPFNPFTSRENHKTIMNIVQYRNITLCIGMEVHVVTTRDDKNLMRKKTQKFLFLICMCDYNVIRIKANFQEFIVK